MTGLSTLEGALVPALCAIFCVGGVLGVYGLHRVVGPQKTLDLVLMAASAFFFYGCLAALAALWVVHLLG